MVLCFMLCYIYRGVTLKYFISYFGISPQYFVEEENIVDK